MRRLAAVVLAAGSSSRLGQPKQLLEIDSEPLIQRTIRIARGAGCSPVVVVLGADAAKVESAIRPGSAVIVTNHRWQDGIGSSLAFATRALFDHASQPDAIIVLVCDQPAVTTALLRTMITTQASTAKSIVACRYAGTIGVPALFDRSCIEELISLTGDTGAKRVLQRDASRVTTIEFAGGEIDIDTWEDYRRAALSSGAAQTVKAQACNQRPKI